MEKNYNGWNNRNSRSSGPGKAKGEPVRVQRKRTKGWKMPENTVYVGRPGKWGNPYVVGVEEWDPRSRNMGTVTPKTVDECIELYKVFILEVNKNFTENNIHELKGKNLACFCSLDQPCHADVLLKIANK